MSRSIDIPQLEAEADEPVVEEELTGEEITVHYPEQLFSPAPYNSFRVGGIYYKTVVQPGETPAQAYARAWKYIAKMTKDQFVEVRRDFWDRYNSMEI